MTTEQRDGYTIYRPDSPEATPFGFVVRTGSHYLVDGRLVHYLDYDGAVYRSAEDAVRAIENMEAHVDQAAVGTHSPKHYQVAAWTKHRDGAGRHEFPSRTLDPATVAPHPRGLYPVYTPCA